MQPKQDQKNNDAYRKASGFILIGEDDVDDEDLLKEIFTSIDDSLSLMFINNGRKLLTSLEEMEIENLRLMLLDYNMPEMNGAEILNRLKQKGFLTHIPKVIWSTSNSETYRKQCLQAGAHDYIIKPSSMKELRDVVSYMISLCRAGNNNRSKM